MHADRAILNLLYTYAELVDAADFEAVGALFAHGAVEFAGTDVVCRGADEVARQYERTTRRHADQTLRTQHQTLNPILDVDEGAGTARCRSRFTVLQQTPELALQPIISGRYHDRFERAGGAWRFAWRTIHIDLVGDLSEHLRVDLAAERPSRPRTAR